jgi:hypothetical protein
VALHRGGEHSTAELADLFGVARSTIYRALQRDKLQGAVRRRTTAAESARGGERSPVPGVFRKPDRCGTPRPSSGLANGDGVVTAPSYHAVVEGSACSVMA